MGLDNENPTLFEKTEERQVGEKDWDDNVEDEFDSREVFGKVFLKLNSSISAFGVIIFLIRISDLIRGITDPEHPLSLEELRVVDQSLIEVIHYME